MSKKKRVTNSMVFLIAGFMCNIFKLTVGAESMEKNVVRVVDTERKEPISDVQYKVLPGTLEGQSLWTTTVRKGLSVTYYFNNMTDWTSIVENSGIIELEDSGNPTTLFVRAAGYETASISLPVESNYITLRLSSVPALKGRVIGQDGEGVPHVPIYIGELPEDFLNRSIEHESCATTDKNGFFSLLTYPRAFPLMLTCYSESFGAGSTELAADDVGNMSELQICRVGLGSGQFVLSGGGVDWAEANIEILSDTGAVIGRSSLSVNVDTGEIAKVECLPTGRGRIEVYGLFTRFLIFGGDFAYENEFKLECGRVIKLGQMKVEKFKGLD